MTTNSLVYVEIEMKKCKDCLKTKPHGNFNKSYRSKDGFTTSCIKCLAQQKEAKGERDQPWMKYQERGEIHPVNRGMI